ncbi:MAG: CPBP family glutamic-type intramembrane protease [Leptothrix sp. (in: b-proteobacteria)]
MTGPLRLTLLVLVAAPLLEEIVFRLGLHEALLRRRMPPWRANAGVAVAFALAHVAARVGLAQALSLASLAAWLTLLPAWGIGWLYQRGVGGRRRLWPCVLAHAACNALWWLGGLHGWLGRLLAGWP